MFAGALGFPDYYGMNWDAFYDCVRDPEQSCLPRHLIIQGMSTLRARLPHDADALRQVLAHLSEERSDVKVVFEE
jgi:RNAse (barnase) inhibitor barstar